jgi:hypothetical protein
MSPPAAALAGSPLAALQAGRLAAAGGLFGFAGQQQQAQQQHLVAAAGLHSPGRHDASEALAGAMSAFVLSGGGSGLALGGGSPYASPRASLLERPSLMQQQQQQYQPPGMQHGGLGGFGHLGGPLGMPGGSSLGVQAFVGARPVAQQQHLHSQASNPWGEAPAAGYPVVGGGRQGGGDDWGDLTSRLPSDLGELLGGDPAPRHHGEGQPAWGY